MGFPVVHRNPKAASPTPMLSLRCRVPGGRIRLSRQPGAAAGPFSDNPLRALVRCRSPKRVFPVAGLLGGNSSHIVCGSVFRPPLLRTTPQLDVGILFAVSLVDDCGRHS